MEFDQTTSANGRTPRSSGESGPRPEPEGSQAKRRRQAMAIDALRTFERGATALKAENSLLRAENDRLRRRGADPCVGAVTTRCCARMSRGARGEEAGPCRD